MAEGARAVWGEALARGLAKRDPARKPLEIYAGGGVAIGTGLEDLRNRGRPQMALYIGGMGARGKNFYNDYLKRMGYEAAAAKIQDAYLDGRRDEAIAAVPDSLIDETALVGPPERIKDRLQVWKESSKDGKIGTMLLGNASIEALRIVAEAVL